MTNNNSKPQPRVLFPLYVLKRLTAIRALPRNPKTAQDMHEVAKFVRNVEIEQGYCGGILTAFDRAAAHIGGIEHSAFLTREQRNDLSAARAALVESGAIVCDE